MRLSAPPPLVSLLVAGLICLAVAAAAIGLATATPWLGLNLPTQSTPDAQSLRLTAPSGPAAALAGRTLVAIDDIPVAPGDLVDEPDYLPDYTATQAFFDHQTRLREAVSRPNVRLTLADDAGRRSEVVLQPQRRPIASLPPEFWVQIVFALGSLLIAAWVWSLRPGDIGAVMFGLSGVGMLISAPAAAVYSTRDLILDGGVFRLLSSANHFGPQLFGYAMICLFLVYPRRLAPRWVMAPLAVVVILWFLADALHIAPSATVGGILPMLLMVGAIAAIVGVQWWATRRDPVGRTALRWLGVSVVVCSVACMALLIAPSLMGLKPIVSQGYAFGFFFLIYVALAVGLRRSRMFQLDEWAFRIAFYAGAALLLIALDAALILLLRTDSALSLGASLLAVAFLYLPLRDLLWRRLVVRRRISDEALFGDIVDTALAANPTERAERWRALLVRLFDPLEIEASATAVADAAIRDDGMALALPATTASPALLLRGPWSGRGLFGPSHLRLARRAMDMIARTETRRDAYERGATEERVRIAQDLHDDVGALLLSGLHKGDLDDTRQVIRNAMFDVRMIASELGSQQRELGDLLADLRHETRERLQSAGLSLDWPPVEADAAIPLDFATYKAVRSSVRELVSNVIRHAEARRVTVLVSQNDHSVRIEIADDGRGFEAGAGRAGGMGLTGVARRMNAVSGAFDLPTQPQGACSVLTFPLKAAA